MAQCKGSAQEFIQDAFSPMVGVLCSHDAELVCQKNNLSFVELVQPFCKMTTEAHIRDTGSVTHTIRNLRINVRDMNQSPPQATVVKKMLNEAVSNALPANYESPRNSVLTVGAYDLQLSSSTPWFEAFRECFLQVSHPSDHEFLKHFLACIFVVSSSHPDAMDQFSKLTTQQHQQQHHQQAKYPRWFCPNVLRYYVLIHDVTAEEGAKGEAVYQSMKSMYGVNNCHLLYINSRSPNAPNDPDTEQGSMPDPWSQFMPKKQQESNELGALDALGGADTAMFPTHVQEGQPSALTTSQSLVSLDDVVDNATEATEESEPEPPSGDVPDSSTVINHPLAPISNHDNHSLVTMETTDNMSPRDHQNNPLLPDQSVPGRGDQSRSGTHGACLTLSDHDRLRIFVHEFTIRGLLPWVERTLRTLNDQVTSRKGIHRSFLNISKKWFVGNKPVGQSPTTEKSNVIFTDAAPEMQMRRLADLAFMFQLYETAYQTYHAAKKEFNSEHAWLHFAGALELACLSVFMQGANSQRQYPSHYMETAISTYLNSCKSTQFATRCTLLSTEALKSKQLYTEAALQFIKMTSEDSDLRSALLLEQAAHCFIKMKQPMVRKYSFHMILAGHRFSKAGQRRHALRSYGQALQVYKGKDWTLAEDHINFTIGRQSFNLKQLDNATAAFRHLLCVDSRQSPPQQNAFLREYLFVFKQQVAQHSVDSLASTGPAGGSTGLRELPQLPLPSVDGNATKVLCVAPPRESHDGTTPAQSIDLSWDEADGATWQKLEELAVKDVHAKLPHNHRSVTSCFTDRTRNSHNPLCVLGEPVTVEVCLTNPLRVPLVLTDLVLLWRFISVDFNATDEKPPQPISNEQALAAGTEPSHEDIVESQVLPELVLPGGESQQVRLTLVAQATGELHVTGLAYNLGTNSQTQPSLAGSTDDTTKPSFIAAITIKGKATLDVQGPRLNTTKEEKASKMYGPDRRLDLVIVPRMPLLEVEFSSLPASLLCGEVRQISLRFRNAGHFPLCGLRVVSTRPELYTVHSGPAEPDAPYPTLANPADTDTQEHVTHPPNVHPVTTVTLPGDRLNPGDHHDVAMYLRGPKHAGIHDLHFLFYYQSSENNPKLQHRVLTHKSCLTVHQSLSLKASAVRAQTGDSPSGDSPSADSPSGDDTTVHSQDGTRDKPLDDLVVSLEIENLNNVADSSITEFSVLQVSCVSQRWHLGHLSTQRHSDIRISSLESTLLCLRAGRCQHHIAPKSKETIFTNVTFDQHQIHSAVTPCADLYFRDLGLTSNPHLTPDPGPTYVPRGQQPKDPFKGLGRASELDMTLVVLWKAFVVEETGPCSVIHGQHHITLSELSATVTTPTGNKALVEQPPVRIIKEPETLQGPEPAPGMLEALVKYRLAYPRTVTHDFCKHRMCRVRVKLSLHNCSDVTLEVKVNTETHTDSSSPDPPPPGAPPLRPPGGPAFSWGGRGQSTHTLAPDSAHTVCLLAVFTQGGVYDVGALNVVARPSEQIGIVAVDWAPQQLHSTNLLVIQNSSCDNTGVS